MKQVFFWCALMAAIQTRAQDTPDALLASVPRQAIRFSPLHLVSFYPTLEFSLEQRLYKQVTLVGEYGHVLNYGNTNSHSNKRGHKAKAELRYYLHHVRRLTFYAAGEYYWNAIRFDRWAQRTEFLDASFDFPIIRKFAYPVVYDEYGVSLKYGLLIDLPKHLFLDFNAGLRMRVIDYDKPTLAAGEVDTDDHNFLAPGEDDRTVPGFVVGVRLGYRFR